jgi:hypothetical protein
MNNKEHTATLGAAWETYRKGVLVPQRISPAQVHAQRLAFYAGAQAFYSAQMKAAEGDNGLDIINRMAAELMVFQASLAGDMKKH